MDDANGKPGRKRGKRGPRRRKPSAVRRALKDTPTANVQQTDATAPFSDANPPTVQPFAGSGVVHPTTINDMRMIQSAARKRWNIDERLYDVLPGAIAEIAVTPQQSAKLVMAATKTLLTMNSQNQRDDHHATPNAGVNIQGSNVQIVLPDNGRGDSGIAASNSTPPQNGEIR